MIGTVTGSIALCYGTLLWQQAIEGPFLPGLLLLLTLLGLAGLWLLVAVFGLLAYRAVRACLIAPVIVALGITLAQTGTPARLAWELSQRDFETVAAHCLQAAPSTTLPRQEIGLFDVRAISRHPAGCLFRTRSSTEDYGFAYFPGAAPAPEDATVSYTRFDGSWYHVRQA